MNERGFFTVIGICFLLVAAILVKGVQESERNYVDITRNFKDETDLQNIADSALIEAVDIIKSNKIPLKDFVRSLVPRSLNQHEIPLNNSYNADVKVFYEYGKYTDNNKDVGNIWFITRTYTPKGYKDSDFKKIGDKYLRNKGVILISVASREIDGNKVYRRALGYILTDGDEKETDKEDKLKNYIYFMNSL